MLLPYPLYLELDCIMDTYQHLNIFSIFRNNTIYIGAVQVKKINHLHNNFMNKSYLNTSYKNLNLVA